MDYLILQVEEKRVLAAQFRFSGHSSELAGAASFEREGERSLADTLAQVATRVKAGSRVILCLPPAIFAMRTLQLPLDDLRKVREVLPAHLQGELPLPVDELALDVLAAGKGVFLALWAKKNEIAHAIEVCRGAGIEPQIVSSLPFASNYILGVPDDCALYDGNALTVMAAGQLTFFRALEAPSAPQTVPATFSALELTGMPLPPQICLIGPAGSGLAEAGTLPLPAQLLTAPADSGRLFKNEQTYQQLAGLHAVARACQAGRLPDFRRGELAWTAGDATLRKKLLLSALLAAVLIVGLLANKWLHYRAVRADLASVNSSIAALYRDIFPNRAKAVDELAEVKGEIRKLTGTEGSSAYLDLLKKLAEAKGATINGLYEAEVEGRSLRVKGDARSAQAVNQFKESLEPILASSQLGEVKSRPDGNVSFSLTGTLKEVTR